jgi:hypothetical protein
VHPRTRDGLAALTLTAGLLTGCGSDEPARSMAEGPEPASSAPEPSRSSRSRASTQDAERRVSVEVTVAGDSVQPVARAVDVGVGETVELVVTADRPGELHVHASPEQTLSFTKGRSTHELHVDRPGRVDVEEHATATLVMRLLVQ